MKMIKAIQLPIALLGLCLCLWGWATAHSTAGKDFDSTQVSQIIKGKTTSAELITMFGTPYSKQPEANDAERWLYSYATATSHAEGGFFGSIKVETTGFKRNLNVLINKDRVVENFTLDEGPIDKRTTTTNPF